MAPRVGPCGEEANAAGGKNGVFPYETGSKVMPITSMLSVEPVIPIRCVCVKSIAINIIVEPVIPISCCLFQVHCYQYWR